MDQKKWISILVVITVISTSLFLLFLVLYVRERYRSENVNHGVVGKNMERAAPFELNGDYVLASFDTDFSLSGAKSFLIQIVMEAKSAGVILSSRIKQKGWSFMIDPRGRLVFHSDSQKMESIDVEPMDQKVLYSLLYDGGMLQISRNNIIVLRGKIDIGPGLGPLFVGMGIKCDEKTGSCSPSSLLRGGIYEAKFVVNGVQLSKYSGIFHFNPRSISFSDHENRSFVKRDPNDFMFHLKSS